MKISSNINILGGYKNFERIPELISDPDLYLTERTVSSQKKYIRAIKDTFLQFDSHSVKLLFEKAMKSSFSDEIKMKILALQFYDADYLFQLLFLQCFLPVVKSGRVAITKHDIIAFLDELIRQGKIEIEWTRETIETVSRKFLTILKKLGFLDGKVKKTVKEPFTKTDFLIFFHYWLVAKNEVSNTITSSFFPLLLLSEEKYIFLMKQPEIREYINWEYTGDKFIIEPKLSLKEYIHELSN
ncbi:MAG: DUF1819 family protein [Victivallales bacterium]|nr:DUF1819 family protein [Victivallales bacterium]